MSIVQITGSPCNALGLELALRKAATRTALYAQTPVPWRQPDYRIHLDSSTKAPLPTVVTATRGSISHTFSVFGERWAEQAANVILAIFPDLARTPRKLVNPTLHPEVYAARSRQKRTR